VRRSFKKTEDDREKVDVRESKPSAQKGRDSGNDEREGDLSWVKSLRKKRKQFGKARQEPTSLASVAEEENAGECCTKFVFYYRIR